MGEDMPRSETQSAEVNAPGKKMDMGLWLTILFGLVLVAGFGLMLIDILLG
jgi:hypothetical protein